MKKLILFVFILFTGYIGYGQPLFEKNYGSQFYDEALSMIKDTNGDIVMVGRAISWTSGFILKTNSIGDSLWMKFYKPDTIQYSYSWFNKILKYSDSYIAAGYYSELSTYDVYFVKTDVNGDTVYTKLYNTPNLKEQAMDIIIDDLGSIYFLNYVYNSSNNNSSVQLMKTDSLGNVIFTKDYLNVEFNNPVKIVKADNNNMLMLCSKNYTFGSNLYFFPTIVKINNLGDTLWTKKFENCRGGISIWDMIYEDDKIYLLINPVTGYDSLNIPNADIKLYTLDSTGNEITSWTYHWDDKSWPMSIYKTNDGFLVSGYAQEQAHSVLTKLDIFGNSLWTCTSTKTYLISAIITSDGYITVSGSTDRLGFSYNNSRDIYLSKLDSTCLVGIIETLGPDKINVHPNPVVEKLNIDFQSLFSSNVNIQIFNVLGHKFYDQQLDNNNSRINTVSIDVNRLTTGIYLLRLKSDKYTITRKFFKN